MRLVLMIALAGCVPGCDGGLGATTTLPAAAVRKPAVSAPALAEETTFVGTVTSVDIGKTQHPHLKWVVTLAVDWVDSGPSPGESFWFAIHSPSQEGVKVGQRYRITARKKGDGYDLIAHNRVN